ncbi:hypothetical protein [Desulfitobacterium hafniense]|uniref:hypothetical protein n=1 Tax=Desulfitobacterium hafniense TaxID=49338 RepID=UPI0003A02022|nr:hypothetical protein [Desulfitobacterium hafniense]
MCRIKEKQRAGEKAAEYVRDGMIVGLGTGSTVFYAIRKIAELVKNGMKIQGVSTSKSTKNLPAVWESSWFPLMMWRQLTLRSMALTKLIRS